jgi:hypothetical protein
MTAELRIFLRMRVSVASAEQSCFRLIKSCLKSTVSQEQLNGLALIAAEREIARFFGYRKNWWQHMQQKKAREI